MFELLRSFAGLQKCYFMWLKKEEEENDIKPFRHSI